MNFLYPGFLFALFAVAVPILVHLFNFRRFKRADFSNVAFLQEIKEQTSSQERLKSLLVLLARVLALVFLVLAFAQPYWADDATLNAGRRNVVSIYLDNSYSMAAVNKEGSLLDEAKRRAKELVKAYTLNDRFQLLTNDFEGRHQRLLNADEFVKALDEVKISSANRSLQQVVNRQSSIFQGDENRFVYVLSDFQRHFVGHAQLDVPQDIKAYLVKLDANPLPNVSVDSVCFLSPVHTPGGAEQLMVRFKNYGREDAKNISAKVTINGQQKALSNFSVKAGSATIDTLSFSGLNTRWQKGSISIKDYPLTFDDDLFFSFNVAEEQAILAINGVGAPQNLQALFGSDRFFKLTEMSEQLIDYNRFAQYSLVVLNGLQTPSTGLAQALKTYMANGGNVVVFPNTSAMPQDYNAFLTALGLPKMMALVHEEQKVEALELKHPLFKDVFDELPEKITLPTVKQYFTFEDGAQAREDLMKLPGNRLFFARYPQKSGAVYLSAVGLKADDGNFATHPLFVPLLFKVAFASAKDQPLFYTLGNNQSITLQRISLAGNQTLKLEGEGFDAIPETRQLEGATQLYLADQVKKPGFYNLKKGDSLQSVIAFNDDRAESDIRYASNDEIGTLLSGKNVNLIDAEKESLSTLASIQNKESELWKLCLILTLFFIATEILLIKYYHPKIT